MAAVERGNAPGDLLAGSGSVGNGRLLAGAYDRHDERRVGNGIGGEKAHGITFLFREGKLACALPQ